VFYGEERWRRPELIDADESVPEEPEGDDADQEVAAVEPAHPAPDHHPHESPWTMTVPLVILAIGAAFIGGMNLPFAERLKGFEHWLEPVVEHSQAELSLSGATQVLLAVLSLVAAAIGIAVAVGVYLQKRVAPERIERPVLEHGWYIDESIAGFVDGPGEAGFEGTAAFDRTVIDGGVNGVGRVVQWTGGALRRLQTGYVRNYALGVALGAVLLMGYVLTRVAW